MSREITRVNNTFDIILKKNKTTINEASASSDSLFDGDSVKIPSAGAHKGQKGWQSSNAWDIKAAVGTPVYALADGEAITFSDYGRSVIKTQGKKLYGQSFTVKSSNGLPDVYYTHLEGSPIKKGSKIECGQFLGYVMDFPGSSYDHVHIGVEDGHDISEFLTPNGKLKCGGGNIAGGALGSEPTKDSDGEEVSSEKSGSGYDSELYKLALGVGKLFGLKEGFGKNIQQHMGTVSIPGSSNSVIKSPVDGVVNTRFMFGCKNHVTIQIDGDSKNSLQFCGIGKLTVKNGQKVSEGEVIGKMGDKDVAEVLLLNSSKQRQPIDPKKFETKKVKKTDSDKKRKEVLKSDDRVYYDAATAALILAPFSIFKNKYDKDTGEMTQKRWAETGEKNQTDPWVIDTLKKPIKKVTNAFKKKNDEGKIRENIERIKKLL